MAGHMVKIFVGPRGQLKCTPRQVWVKRGDTITWRINKNCPFGILVKFPVSPLSRQLYVTGLGRGARKVIMARVKATAHPCRYPYAIGVYDGGRLRILDPDIIVGPRPGASLMLWL